MSTTETSSEDAEHFRRCHETFAKRENALDIFTDWSVTILPEVVMTKIAHDGTNGHRRGGSNQLQVLGIGSGTGEIDYLFLQQITRKFSKVCFTSLELSQDNINRFKSVVARGNLSGITWDWRQLTLDQYCHYNTRKCSRPKMFHFVYSVFSVTYANNVDAAVMNMYESLDDGGVILMIVVSDQSGAYNLRTNFPQLIGANSLAPVSSREVKGVLDAHGIPYQIITQASRVDITSAFTKGRKEGAEILDHLTRRVNFMKKGEPRLVHELLAYLKGPDCVEREQQSYLFINDWDAVIVTK